MKWIWDGVSELKGAVMISRVLSRYVLSLLLAAAFTLNQLVVPLAYAFSPMAGESSAPAVLGMRISNGQFVLALEDAPNTDLARQQLGYFLSALAIPTDQWWVNLDVLIDESMVMGRGLAYTSLGYALLSGDQRLKRRAMELISEEMILPSNLSQYRFRLWIEPGKIRVKYDNDEVRIVEARLKLKIKGAGQKPAEIEALLRDVVKRLERELNTSAEFSQLRQAYHAMILAAWYKEHMRGKNKALDATVDNYALPTGMDSNFWTRRDFLMRFAQLYRDGISDGDALIAVDAGGFDGVQTPEKIEGLKEKDPLDGNGASDEKEASLIAVGLHAGPAEPNHPFRIYGKVDITGLYPRVGPLAVVSEADYKVKIQIQGKALDKKLGNEIIFVSKSGEVRHIKPPQEGERGVFVSKNKAVVINSKGEIYEKTFSKEELIKFGTSGWRFKIPPAGDELAKERFLEKMEKALEGFARFYLENEAYFKNKYGSDREGVVIARDGRRMGKDFVELAVNVLKRYGIPVKYFDEPVTTPEVAYAIAENEALFAINFTASHNPPDDNGFKVTPADGGAAEEEITDLLGYRLNESINGLAEPIPTAPKEIQPVLLDHDRLIESYAEYVKNTLFEILGKSLAEDLLSYIKDRGMKIMPSALHGAGGKALVYTLKQIFGAEQVLEGEDLKLDPREDFGGLGHPEPDQATTKFLADGLMAMGSPGVGVALDGDADRFGTIDSRDSFISANQFIALALFFFNEIGRQGGVAKTVPTSDLPLALARDYGKKAVETKVGFKYMKPIWKGKDIVVAGEESAHVGLPGTKTWGDGIMMSALAVMMEAYFLENQGKSMAEMLDFVQENILHRFYDYSRKDVPLTDELKSELESLFSRLKRDSNGQERISGRQLSALFPFVDWKKIESDIGKEIRELILLDGVKIVFEDDSWFAIRLSGTEPVARLYVEGVGKDKDLAGEGKEKLITVGENFLDGDYQLGSTEEQSRAKGIWDWGRRLSRALEEIDENNYRSREAWENVLSLLEENSSVFARYISAVLLLNGISWDRLPRIDSPRVLSEDLETAKIFFNLWAKKMEGKILPEDIITEIDVDYFNGFEKAIPISQDERRYKIYDRIGVYSVEGRPVIGWYADGRLFPIRELEDKGADFIEFLWTDLLTASLPSEELDNIVARFQEYYGEPFSDEVGATLKTLLTREEFSSASPVERLLYLASFERRLSLGDEILGNWFLAVIMSQGLSDELREEFSFYGSKSPVGYELASSLLQKAENGAVTAKGGIDLGRVSLVYLPRIQ